MNDWGEYKLGELAEITSSKRIFYADYVSQGVRFYRSKEIIEKSLGEDSGEPLYITREKFEDIRDKFGAPMDGDLLISAVGERSGIPYVVKNLGDFYFKDGNLIWFRNIKSELDINFFCYWMKSAIGQMSLESIMIGSAQKALTISGLKGLEIKIPSSNYQKSIAAVLSSLDNKIDLLHRQTDTLEALAQIFFRRWFVEEAKEEWSVKPLSSIADFLNGLACQKFPPKNSIDRLPVLKIKELSSGITENSDWASTDIKPIYIVNNGDVIFAWSASLMVKIWYGQDCILNQHLFKVTSKGYPKWFYYLWCKYHLAEFISISASHATTMGHIKRGDLDEAMVLVPTDNELKIMTETIEPLIQKQIYNNNQIHTLTTLRDTLLPKLMSGEVRVE
jgi:type I restriction enzyme S subunit